jgi:hypothetical protein
LEVTGIIFLFVVLMSPNQPTKMADSKQGATSSSWDEPSERVRSRWTKKWWQIGGEDVVFVPVSKGGPSSSKRALETETVDGSVFADSRAADVYEPIEKYEGRHRFDPKATWIQERARSRGPTDRAPQVASF